MQSAPDTEPMQSEPLLRAMHMRLRRAIASIVAAICACIVLAGIMALLAYQWGVDATLRGLRVATTARSDVSSSEISRALDSALPPVYAYVLLGIGFLIVGTGLYLIVRRPYAAAYLRSVELAAAYRALEAGSLETIAALNATVEARDAYTAGHGLRVTLISLLIGAEMGLGELELDQLRHAATFHDIGKIAVPDSVLQKTGPLTDIEFEQMKLHPIESARICSKVAVLRGSVPAIRHHHERIDGRGYPDGLAGNDIPLLARIMAVADTWDAMTSDRPYRLGQPAPVALDEIRRVSGTQLDPEAVEAFVAVLAKDPWMFGLTEQQIAAPIAAPGYEHEWAPRGSLRDGSLHLDGGRAPEAAPAQIDWSHGLDDEDPSAGDDWIDGMHDEDDDAPAAWAA